MGIYSKADLIKSLAGAACLGAVLAPAGMAHAGETIDFTISDGRVVPSEDFAVKVSVLGAAITSSGVDMPVTVKVNINGQSFEPFGDADDPGAGDVNDHSPPRHFIVQEQFDEDSTIDVTGTSWNTSGSVYLRRNSHSESPAVKVLRDGDPVPDISGFENQTDAVEFVRKYIDPETNTMTLHENQSIYLFELGTTRLTSSAADFQDLVVLVTLGESPEALADEGNDLADAAYD
jgi:hypothetical protein